MNFPFARDGIPTGEREALRDALRRTALVRASLAVVLLGALLVAFWLARDAGVRQAPLVPSESTAMVALDLSASIGDFRRVATVLRRVAREAEHAGLVVFSGGAYELLPPGTPARELGSYVRFFTPLRDGSEVYPTNPWDVAEFRGGTSITSGLDAARVALEREGVSRGAILLASDLDVEHDSEAVTEAVVAVRRAGIELRIVPVGALPEHRAFFEQLVGRAAFLADEDADAPVRTNAERRFGGTLPWPFLLVAALAVIALAANERFLARLEVRS
jgi:hypothetical protein